jgi:hypothetical protein
MDVRDAVEADAERLAELTGAPVDVMRNLVHDRTVRVATEASDGGTAAGEGDAGDGADEGAGDGEETILGFVSFDARRRTVHVTQMEGTEAATRRLLREPSRFAANEGMSVELLVADGDDSHRSVAEAAGFDEEGPGPRFDGTATVRYRLDP